MGRRKKFNRGVILTAIVILCVSIYLIRLNISQNAEKPAIEKVVASYIQTHVNYSMLPEKYRDANLPIPQAELDSYILKMETDLKKFYVSNGDPFRLVTDRLKKDLQNQKTVTTIVYKFTKDITAYKKYKFDQDTVTVNVESNSSYDGPDVSVVGGPRIKLNGLTTDTIVLSKVDGEWKVVYASINRPSQVNSLGRGMVVR